MTKMKNPHQAHEDFILPDDFKPKKSANIKLTDEQIEFFKRNGYLSIDKLIDEDEVTYIREQYDKWFAAKLGREHGNFFDLLSEDSDDHEAIAPQLLWPSLYGKMMTGFDLYDTQLYANAFEISKSLLGEQATFKGDHAIMKPASKSSLPTPWHQDEAYWDPRFHYESLGVWVALQPVSIENGCMQFVPGSNTFEVLPHHTQDHNPRIHGLEVDDAEKYTENVARCPLPAGGATFHHCRTIHYTGPNRSDTPRRAFTLQFQCNTQERDKPRNNGWNETKITEREKRAKESGWLLRAP